MRFTILGPLKVEDAAGPVAVGGPIPRRLLAVLLVAGGEVVPTDRLTAAVWGDAPPPGAATALRAHLSRLRAALGPEVGLEHRPPGYRLEVGSATLDAGEFEERVRAANVAVAAGDHASAVDELDLALALWHGDALAEFADEEFAAPEVARLGELRAAAVEARAESLLVLGRAKVAVPGLEALVQQHPTREAPAVLLMQALYALGRQADALAVFHALRARLAGELGVEPAAPARSAYQRVLAQDPQLAAAPFLGNLPRRASTFVGRDQEVARVVALLGTAPLVTLTGVGGTGKTRLALEVAMREQGRFADGAWLCELAAVPGGSPIGHAVAAALRIQQRAGATIEETVQGYLRARAVLLVVDNCEHVRPSAARLVADLVQQCPHVVVLATSREPLGVDGEQLWLVPPLATEQAVELFVQRARTVAPDFVLGPAAAEAVATICARVDRLPLGIELAAARMRLMSPQEVAGRMADAPLVGGGRGLVERHRSLEAAIEWSYRLLPPDEQRVFRDLSTFAGGADLRGVHEVVSPEAHEDDVLERLTRLVDRSMVEAVPSVHSRFRMLEVLRAYGHAHVSAEDRAELGRRHTAHYVGLAERAAHGAQGADERAWVEDALADYDNLRVAFLRTRAAGDRDHELRLVAALPELVHLRVGYEASGWAEQAVLDADPEHPRFPAAVGAAARGAWNRGDFPLASRLARLAGGRVPSPGTPRIAYPADVLADVALYAGDVDAALQHYRSEARRARDEGDAVRLVWTLHYVAVCHAVRREPHLGVAAAQESLQVATATANPTAGAMARYALGLVLKKSDPGRALALFDEAATIAADVRNFWWQGVAMMEAAATRAVHGDPIAAAGDFLDVIAHWDRVGDTTQQWLNLRYITRLLATVGAREDAAALHRALVAAGKPSPLEPDRPVAAAPFGGTGAGESAAVALARSALRQLPPTGPA